jgi:hypothetical protein
MLHKELAALLVLLIGSATFAQTAVAPGGGPAMAGEVAAEAEPEVSTAPAHESIDAVIRAATPEVQEFNEHIMVLASPWMEGRLPGTRGFERASQYMEEYFQQVGLEPPVEGKGGKTYRHTFNLAGASEISGAGMKLKSAQGTVELIEGTDFTMTSLGTGSPMTDAPMVFVGYGINDGPEDYQTFTDTDDLTGKVAVVFRFEPMDDQGGSKWSQRGWSGRSSFANKLGAITKRKPAAIVVINPPGATDPRAKTLMRQGAKLVDVPVYMMSAEGADKLFGTADEAGRNAMAMRTMVDSKGVVLPLPKATLTLAGTIEEKPVETANVVGLLPGKGDLKDECIVIGGHLDHLGQGFFGSREGGGKLHPGADDNASGAAGIMMLARSLSRDYKSLPEGASARSILFMGFSAEESGLNGSEAYVANPIIPLDKTTLMLNFDMIGRVKNKRLRVSGTDTGEGMHEWVQQFFDREKSGLEVVQAKGTGSGGSDHTSFVMKGVPILFAIIADFHDDYHTSRDTMDLINREDAVLAINLWHDIALAAAQRPERFPFKAQARSSGAQAALRVPAVRFGVRTEDGDGGLKVMEVVEGASADLAGMKVGDMLVSMSKLPVTSRSQLMEKLLELKPDETVQVVVRRDGQEVALFVKMQARK